MYIYISLSLYIYIYIHIHMYVYMRAEQTRPAGERDAGRLTASHCRLLSAGTVVMRVMPHRTVLCCSLPRTTKACLCSSNFCC